VRIVFLNPSGALGGAETALLEMLAALREARPAWTLNVIASAPGPLIEKTSALGIPSTSLTFPASFARLGEWGRRGSANTRVQFGIAAARALPPVVAYAVKLRRRLAAIDPDVVHTNGLKMHLLGSWCRPRRARVVWHMHDYPDSRPLTAWLLRMSRSRCAAAIANSNSVAEHTRRLFGSSVQVHTVYNAVDLNRFHPSGPRLDLDNLAGLPPLDSGGIRIGLVGTFARWKGHDVFLHALSRVKSAVPIRGYVIGGPIYETDASQYSIAELQTLAKAAGPDHVVGFTGPVSDVPSALRTLDIVVHASTEPEPFGLVIAEAMASGRPLVVSKAGGAAEITQEGAVFHQPGDADELASCLSQLASSPTLRKGLGAAGRDAATRLFSREQLASSLMPIYESL
jgi:glycosyltransferase involved in cell wall biosynthesis